MHKSLISTVCTFFYFFIFWEDTTSLQRINVGCVCADGAGTVHCSLVAVASVAFASHTHGDEQCMPGGGSWKVHGGLPGAESAGQFGDCMIWRERDLK